MSLFQGIPLFWQAWFSLAFCVVLYVLFWKISLASHALLWHHRQGQDRRSAPPKGQDDLGPFYWYFLVPALDEEITITHTMQQLLSLPTQHKRVVAIDDSSQDHTPQILDGMGHPHLHVIHRILPQAQQGKSRALNQAWRWAVQDSQNKRLDPSRVLVCVVDGDGYLDRDAIRVTEQVFADPQVGGMQLQVRIYNRQGWLTRLQDLEFGLFGDLFQAGRSCWRSACLGGSGQTNRLSALNDLAQDDGPWQDRLTEDQDLSMRLLIAGWHAVHSNQTQVHQQGLSQLRPLLKQRTRWAQGNLQLIPLCRALWRAPISRWAKWELTGFLVSPLFQMIVGISLLGAFSLALWAGVDPIPQELPMLLLFSILAFMGVSLGLLLCFRDKPWVAPLALFPYLLYTWILWPVLIRASFRLLRGNNSWSKTQREVLA